MTTTGFPQAIAWSRVVVAPEYVFSRTGRATTRAEQALADAFERHVDLEATFGGVGPSVARVVGRRDDAERALRQTTREIEEEREVTARIGADRDDVVIELRRRVGAEVLDVHAEGDELDPRAVLAEPCAQLLDLPPAVRDDRVEPTKRVGEERLAAGASELRKALGQPDRRVDDRRLHAAEAPEQRERDADRVDGREHDVGAIHLASERARARSRPSTRRRGAPLDRGRGPLLALPSPARTGLEIVPHIEARAPSSSSPYRL